MGRMGRVQLEVLVHSKALRSESKLLLDVPMSRTHLGDFSVGGGHPQRIPSGMLFHNVGDIAEQHPTWCSPGSLD